VSQGVKIRTEIIFVKFFRKKEKRRKKGDRKKGDRPLFFNLNIFLQDCQLSLRKKGPVPFFLYSY